MSARVLIVDDQTGMRRALELVLHKEGFDARSSGSRENIGELLAEFRPDVVLTDLRMQPLSGLDVLREAGTRAPDASVIIMTAYGTIDSAVEAMRLGAYDYIVKPFKNPEVILRINKALERKALHGQVRDLRRDVDVLASATDLVAHGPAMRYVAEQVRTIAATPLTVLITGETGTGKNLIAKSIHSRAPQAQGRFVTVNMAAVPEPLLESELFGHERGAYTGAASSRKGLVEEARNGTLFLDEIGSLPANLQAKLLGVLQDREFRRIGSNQTIVADVRVIAATNSNLEEAVARGEFRQDLFYRLNVARIHVPPLREYPEDIPYLAEAYLERLARSRGHRYHLSDEALHALSAYPFPGNIRELQNALDWAAAIARSDVIGRDDLPDAMRRPPPSRAQPAATSASRATLDQHEREIIMKSISAHGGNLTETARELGIGRTTLWRKIREYGIKH
ncbi:MAG TPA: sigma-54 dependent transcriptional regulator [Burkholderiales bacterium]|nr:sigma-54 dependent transcriptional regulator [Burkholderiales bacterium]